MSQNHDAVGSGSTLVSRALLRCLSHSLPRRGSDFIAVTAIFASGSLACRDDVVERSRGSDQKLKGMGHSTRFR